MIYGHTRTTEPSVNLLGEYMNEELKAFKAILEVMDNPKLYSSVKEEEGKLVHDVLFQAFLRHKKEYDRFNAMLLTKTA